MQRPTEHIVPSPLPAEIETVECALQQELSAPSLHPSPHAGAFWNGIARAWFVTVDGEAVRVEPQPPAPSVHRLVPSPRIDL